MSARDRYPALAGLQRARLRSNIMLARHIESHKALDEIDQLEAERDELANWIGAINVALGEDRKRAPFIDDAVKIVLADRDDARADAARLLAAARSTDRVALPNAIIAHDALAAEDDQ